MPTLTRPSNITPANANAVRLWIAELSYEMSLARKLLKLAQEFEQTQPAAKKSNITIANTDAR